MTEFQYKARDASGGSRTGTVQANSRSIAATQLRSRGLIVLGLEAIGGSRGDERGFDLGKWLKPRPIDVELSLQQLAMMIRSGTTLLSAISALVEQAPRKSLGLIWQEISSNIQSGDNLSSSMAKHQCFPDFVVQMISVGERTGELAPVLDRSIATMKNRRHGMQAIISALIYPVLVILVAIGVTVYMVVYLIPRLEVYLQALGKDMPAMTERMVNASIWLKQYYASLGIVLVAFSVFLLVIYTSREGRMWVDQFALRVPIIGRLIRLCETSTFARSLSIMLGSGITLIDGLGTVEKLVYNRYLAQTISHARDKIIQGSTFADAIDEHGTFSPMLKKMVAVGQQSGDLKGVLHEVADYQDDQFGALIRRLNAVVTPALTVGVGGIVGYVYIAFFVALLAAGS